MRPNLTCCYVLLHQYHIKTAVMNFCCVIKLLMTHPSGLWLCKIFSPFSWMLLAFFMGCKNSEIMEKAERASSGGFSLCLAIGHGITFNGWWRVGCLFVGPNFLEHAKLLTLIFFILNKIVLTLLQCLKKDKIVSFYYITKNN